MLETPELHTYTSLHIDANIPIRAHVNSRLQDVLPGATRVVMDERTTMFFASPHDALTALRAMQRAVEAALWETSQTDAALRMEVVTT